MKKLSNTEAELNKSVAYKNCEKKILYLNAEALANAEMPIPTFSNGLIKI